MNKNPEKIKSMFGSIAKKYDVTNDVLSLGSHILWKKSLINFSKNAKANSKILDCATGTGDLAFMFNDKLNGEAKITATDFCPEMLEQAVEKAKKKDTSNITFEIADATNLQFKDDSFDLVTISFGIRNVVDVSKAISEFSRVLKPGGELLMLEFGQPHNSLFAKVYSFYSKKVLPVIGSKLSGDRKAYEYLEESSAEFPCRDNFLELVKNSGKFENLNYKTYQNGICYLYSAYKKSI